MSYKRITLCGSTKFKKAFQEWNARLTLQGNVIYSVAFFSHHDNLNPTKEQKALLDLVHLRKIDNSDEIFVLDVGGYIGESTRNEINHAAKNGKAIKYLSKEYPEWKESDCSLLESQQKAAPLPAAPDLDGKERIGTASEFIDRAVLMLKDEYKDEWLVAGYNGILSLLSYAKAKIERMDATIDDLTKALSQSPKPTPAPSMKWVKEVEGNYQKAIIALALASNFIDNHPATKEYIMDTMDELQEAKSGLSESPQEGEGLKGG